MKYVFVLSKEDVDIAKEEVLTLVNTTDCTLIENILIIDTKENENTIKKSAKRLAYTNSIYSLLFESSYGDFLKNIEEYDWNSVYKDNFCIRANKPGTIDNCSILKKNPIKKPSINKKTFKNKIINKNNEKLYSEKNLASYVWKNVDNPKVDLKNAKTHIEIFFLEDKIYCCLLLKKLKHGFDERKSHLRPRPSPISLHPKLARAMVNLTWAGDGEIIFDPFCGSGGILIESGLMGFGTIGYDINKKMVWKSMVNLKHYKIKNYKLGIKDFFKINKKYNYIVADLPYGLNTNIMENVRVTKSNKKQLQKYLIQFYSKIIKKLDKILIKRAVIIFPDYVNYKKIIKNSGINLKIINEFESYVHGNLTRKIVVMEK